MKLLGIDFGLRRIGIATTDATGTITRAVTTIDRKVTPQYLPIIEELLSDLQPDKIIFGLPLGHDDEETEMFLNVRRFQEKIYTKLAVEIPFDFQDESYSSVRTQRVMRTTSRKKRRRDKGTIDRIAACIILEDYIRESSGSLLLY